MAFQWQRDSRAVGLVFRQKSKLWRDPQSLPVWDKKRTRTMLLCPVVLLWKAEMERIDQGQNCSRISFKNTLFQEGPSDTWRTGNFCSLFTFLQDCLGWIMETALACSGADEEVGQDTGEISEALSPRSQSLRTCPPQTAGGLCQWGKGERLGVWPRLQQ